MTTAVNRFTQLYEAHYGAVERYVRRRVDDSAVRDVVAEVFLIAWRRLDELPAEPLPWLYGTARRVLANERRGTQRRVVLAGRIAENTGTESGDHADAVAGRMAIATAFGRLSDQDAECLRLVGWEELTLREAAQVLGCSLPAVAMRLHRARARLRRELSATAETVPARLIPARGEQS